MPIYRLIQEGSFDQPAIERMVAAYESVLQSLKDAEEPLREVVARKVIEITRSGERDPAVICDRTLGELGFPRGI